MPSASRRGEAREGFVALAAAVCLFLSSIEYIIPRPLPFLRLGLANLPLLVALDLLPAGQFFMLILLKVLGQALIQGSLFSVTFLFSLTGTLASGLVMFAARRLLGASLSLIGISILGALASSLAQLSLARLFIFGASAWLIAPPFLLMGLVTSTILGGLAQLYLQRSAWLPKIFPELKGKVHRRRAAD